MRIATFHNPHNSPSIKKTPMKNFMLLRFTKIRSDELLSDSDGFLSKIYRPKSIVQVG